MEPSNELKEMAKNAKKFTIDNLLEWLKVFQAIGIEMGWVRSAELQKHDENKTCALGEDDMEGLIHIDHCLTPEIDDSMEATMIQICFLDDNKARIEKKPYQGEIPAYLLEKIPDTFGFEGTWEEVTRKWIELNAVIAANVSPVPEDLK